MRSELLFDEVLVTRGHRPTQFRLRAFDAVDSCGEPNMTVAVVTDAGVKNPGPSLVNAAEAVCARAADRVRSHYPHQRLPLLIFEYYEPEEGDRVPGRPKGLDLIRIEGGKATWHPAGPSALAGLLGATPAELSDELSRPLGTGQSEWANRVQAQAESGG